MQRLRVGNGNGVLEELRKAVRLQEIQRLIGSVGKKRLVKWARVPPFKS